jgi:thioredoxin-like negative regulator of GroEL
MGETALAKPQLLFFYSSRDGRARRVEGYLAQVLQRRRNHDTFAVRRIDVRQRPDLADRFRVGDAPALIVVAEKTLRARLEGPQSAKQIAEVLGPWLR